METHQLCDIYTYEFTPFWQTSSFYLLIGIFFLISTIGLGIWYYRWRRAHRPPEPAWQKAFKTLNTMAAQKFFTKSEYKEAYFALTTTIKAYLFEEHGWPVRHKTDDELIKFLKGKQMDATVVALLEQIVQGMLEIKFANAQALYESYQRHIRCAQEFIEQTIKQQADENKH